MLTLPQRICTNLCRAFTRLLYGLILILFLPMASAQIPSAVVSLTELPGDGLLLTDWRFRPGNDPNGDNPQLDDRQWDSIDPTKDIRDLPQLQRAGIGWLRLHITTGDRLPPTMLYAFQSVASEVYLDGQLLYRFGTVSTNPDYVRAYNPNAAFSLPLRPASEHILAVRFACEPGLDYNRTYLRWDAAAVQFRLFSATALPAVLPISLQAAYLDTVKIGISLILFILHLSLFFAYRTQRANGYAAAMYLILSLAFLAKTMNSAAHSMDLRMVLHYISMIDAGVPCIAILTFYSLFNFRKGWFFWLAIGSVGHRFIPFPADYQWAYVVFSYYLQLELLRLSVVATRRKLLGSRIVAVGVFCNLGVLVGFSLMSALNVSFGGNEWLYHSLFMMAFLCIPLTLSLRLALEHGWINRQLVARLQDVETLSARNLAQQQEQQQILARQNEALEQQVAERTQKLRQQANQLQELDQVKSRFVTNLTHEFRTPLSLIISPVEKLLQDSRFDRPMLTTVQRNAGQLLRLINQLLDLSKLESHYMAVSPVQGNVADFIRQTMAVFQRSATQNGVTLTCVVADLPQQEHLFDADKWEKILSNLLANALKFTTSGGHVTLTIMPVLAAGEVTGVHIELADSGIGIAPEHLPHIFDRFYQADASNTRAYEGTGIGLALVNELVGLLGGTIAVESALGVGTTCRLMLPVLPVSATVDTPKINWRVPEPGDALPIVFSPGDASPFVSSVPAALNEHSVDNQSVSRILIVEDNHELRAFLVGELSAAYTVFQAADGVAGWAIARAELPDIVLTDVMMPRMDGYQLTRLIKENPDTDHIAVVMLTAKTAQPSRMEGLQRGADDYLTKPFSVAELHLRLHNLTTRQQKLGEHYRQQFALPAALPIPEALPGEVGVAMDFPGDASPDPFLRRIYETLDQHLDDPTISVDWLADQLAMSRKTLYRKVQSLIQLPPADLIRQYRLRRAAELLRAGHNVAETADLVGFNTPSHFSIVFKDFYQKTPTEFAGSRVKIG